jgi:hypothetical protein
MKNNLFRIFYEHKGQVWHTVVTGKTPEDARAKFGRMHPHVKDLGFFMPAAEQMPLALGDNVRFEVQKHCKDDIGPYWIPEIIKDTRAQAEAEGKKRFKDFPFIHWRVMPITQEAAANG